MTMTSLTLHKQSQQLKLLHRMMLDRHRQHLRFIFCLTLLFKKDGINKKYMVNMCLVIVLLNNTYYLYLKNSIE